MKDLIDVFCTDCGSLEEDVFVEIKNPAEIEYKCGFCGGPVISVDDLPDELYPVLSEVELYQLLNEFVIH